ncbi:hypothetical protein AVL61_15170 [Kocuria rosea subsp. polaris]|uniref:Uncharacterized protein n=1 Tax=Kocuria rosea subsp. polaris TaxID=136273 RepID=A0A0W8I6I0_KOCRO|nr:gluconate 2-dehydrogenase subunit 3 family protein [Kocuria polaris]KUG53869.1 hypothetical protein AVL61_15170 [Kocuria polaris]
MTTLVNFDDVHVLNQCTRYITRDTTAPRHDFGQYASDDPRAVLCEPWRFPLVDSYFDRNSPEESYRYNTVTFVYDGRATRPTSVEVVGTFGELFSPVALRPVRFLGDDTGFWAVGIRVAKGQSHRYLVGVDEQWDVDSINPQYATSDNGRTWSRFFTEACQIPLVLSARERELLGRLVAHLLPFRLPENSKFIREVYNQLDRLARVQEFPLAYRLDEEVGVVNYIDKLLARSEQHHADDYHTCLAIIDRLLRQRYGGLDTLMLPLDAYAALYDEMATNVVDGWDTSQYADPQHFLLLLRRHALTGAFAHPRTGGNSGAAGWVYLESRYQNSEDETLFDWRRALEAPLGRNTDYRG